MSGRVVASGGRRQVVGVGLARHLEHGHGDRLRHFRTAGEPLGVGPRLHHFLGLGIARPGLGGDVVEVVEHQQGLLQALGGDAGDFGVVEQLDQRMHVVAADHGAEQLGGLGLADQRDRQLAVGNRRQEAGLDLGGIVHARRHAVRQQLHQERLLAGRRVLDQLDQLGDLLGIECERRNAEGGAFGDVLAIGLQHEELRAVWQCPGRLSGRVTLGWG